LNDRNIIIIASQPRSGSTLLQALLSNNKQVATVSEPWLLLPFLSYNNPELSKAIYSSVLASNGINDFKRKINTKKFDNDLSQFLLNQYSQLIKNNEKFVIDKTPRYYEILNEIIKYFPNSKIIILKRNPFAVLSSIINTWDKNNLNELLEFKRDILNAPIILQNFIDKNSNNPNVKTIKYETLINTPENEIQKLYEWLNIPFNDSVIDYAKNTKYKGEMGDPTGIHKSSKPNNLTSEKWIKTYNKKEWSNFFKGYADYLSEEFLTHYGYSNKVPSQKTQIFNHYLNLSYFEIKLHNISLIKLLKYKALIKLGLINYS